MLLCALESSAIPTSASITSFSQFRNFLINSDRAARETSSFLMNPKLGALGVR